MSSGADQGRCSESDGRCPPQPTLGSAARAAERGGTVARTGVGEYGRTALSVLPGTASVLFGDLRVTFV